MRAGHIFNGGTKMDRLTKRHGERITNNERQVMKCSNYCDYCGNADCDTIRKMIRKLAEYEDLEEQGLLIRMPCKVGDTVYEPRPDRGFISEYTITSFEVYNDGIFYHWKLEDGIYSYVNGFNDYSIGETVFFNRIDAENKMKEMEELQ